MICGASPGVRTQPAPSHIRPTHDPRTRLHVKITSSLIRDPPRASRHPVYMITSQRWPECTTSIAQRPEAMNTPDSQSQSACRDCPSLGTEARHPPLPEPCYAFKSLSSAWEGKRVARPDTWKMGIGS